MLRCPEMAEKSEINAQENQESLSQLMATQVEELEMFMLLMF